MPENTSSQQHKYSPFLPQVASKLLMHEHAQTWSVLKTLYSSVGGPGTTSTPYATSAVNSVSHVSGGGMSTTGNAEPTAGK